ncbi:YSIRK-type signal peptide-containing protein [Vibrio parahaemolyticus]
MSGFYFFYKNQKYSFRSVPIGVASVIVTTLKN